MPKQRLVVIGNGMAGARVVEEVLAQGGADRYKIAIFSEEASGSYDRLQLADVMNGSQHESEIVQRSLGWYQENQIQLHGGQRALLVSRAARTVYGPPGVVEPYDKLVFATGSSPYFPSLQNLFDAKGVPIEGVVGFRTLADCRTIAALATKARRVAVLGGGLLALEAARGLIGIGCEVHLIHSGSQLLYQHLDEYAGQVVERLLESTGVHLHLNRTVRSLSGQRSVSGLVLSDGSSMDCELVVVASGLIPNTWLAYQCGLTVERGIAVDSRLCSLDDRHVHALGECAQLRDRIYGSKDAIFAQARVIAEQLLAEHSDARYHAQPGVSMKVMGLDIACIGNVRAIMERDQIAELRDPQKNEYKKIVLRDRRVIGAVLLGETSAFSRLSLAFDSNARLSDAQLAGLIGPAATKASDWARVA